MNPDTPTTPSRSAAERAVRAAAWLLIAVGTAGRAAPLFDHGGRLLRQWIAEDGYIMLLLARNIALGKGMSHADGDIVTNGTQPGATYLYALCFELVGGDRVAGVLVVQLLSLVIALASTYLLYRLCRALWGGRERGGTIALFAAALWFASPLVMAHSMNGQETGLYALLLLATAWAFVVCSRDATRNWSALTVLGLGVLCGLVFYGRNDGVFFVFALCAVRVAQGVFRRGAPVVRRGIEALVIGLIAGAMSLPWLMYNLRIGGSIVPVSGHATAGDAGPERLATALVKLFEYVTLMLPLPRSVEQVAALPVVAAAVLVGVAVAAVLLSRRAARGAPALVCVIGGFALLLLLAYSVKTGALGFFSRYFMPVSPFLAIVTVSSAGAVWLKWDRSKVVSGAVVAAAVLSVVLAAGLAYRHYRNGHYHPHFQVVGWVEQNLGDEDWVMAVQTGTLGFFHDRTINLDGKLNPHALEAAADDNLAEYAASLSANHLVDWADVAVNLGNDPAWSRYFEVLVVDRKIDPVYGLGVMRRREPAEASIP